MKLKTGLKIFVVVLMSSLLFLWGCSEDETDAGPEIHALDLNWPVGSVLTYDVSVSSSVKYYYVREGESVKEYDISVMCNYGYHQGNNPGGDRDYSNNVCEEPMIGTSPYHLSVENFTGNLEFNIYGKVDEELGSCVSSCTEKKVYYQTSVELLGDFFKKDIYENAWFYDSGDSVWYYSDDVNRDQKMGTTYTDMRSYFVNRSAIGAFFVNYNLIDNIDGDSSLGGVPDALVYPVEFFNVGKFKPWNDTAWPLSGDNWIGIGVYKGRSSYTLNYNGRTTRVPVYRVDMYTTVNSGTNIENYIADCANSDFESEYDYSVTYATRNNDCAYAVFPFGSYYWNSNNLLMKESLKVTFVTISAVGYDCIYVEGGTSNMRRVSSTAVQYDENGDPMWSFANCDPANIKKFVAYRVVNAYITLEAKEWQR